MAISTDQKQQYDEAGSSPFCMLPNELVLKVMTYLGLEERLCFMDAFPKFEGFCKVKSLQTRTIADRDIYLTRQHLERVLDPNGTAIKLSNINLNAIHGSQLISDVSTIMPNLQEFTLKNCILDPVVCECYDQPKWEFFSCSSLESLTNIKVFKYNSCTYSCDDPDLILRSWRSFYHQHLFRREFRDSLAEVSFANTFSNFDLMRHLNSLIIFLLHSGFKKNSDINFVIENLEGESVSLNKTTLAIPPSSNSKELLTKFIICLKAFYRMMDWTDDFWPLVTDSEESKMRCGEMQVKSDGTRYADIRVIVDFDMREFKRELASENV